MREKQPRLLVIWGKYELSCKQVGATRSVSKATGDQNLLPRMPLARTQRHRGPFKIRDGVGGG